MIPSNIEVSTYVLFGIVIVGCLRVVREQPGIYTDVHTG